MSTMQVRARMCSVYILLLAPMFHPETAISQQKLETVVERNADIIEGVVRCAEEGKETVLLKTGIRCAEYGRGRALLEDKLLEVNALEACNPSNDNKRVLPEHAIKS